jgi:hypothetical protein
MVKRRYLKRSWVNPKLKVGKSRIHGEGVFANEKILQGEKLMEFGGDMVSRKKAFSDDYKECSVWPVSSDHYLSSPTSDTGEDLLDEYLNHSCNANAWLVDKVTLVAKRDIDPGEEITLDQGTWNFDDAYYVDNQEPCTCGAINCRHILTENDWKLSDVQERYKNHFHPMAQKMIDSIHSE